MALEGVDLTGKNSFYTANQYLDDYAAKSFRVRADYLPLVKGILIPNYEIIDAERKIFAEIEKDYAGKSPLFIPILKGAVRFSMDMFRFAERLDPEFEFMSASSYGQKLDSGEVVLDLKGMSRLLDKLKDRHRPVIIVEDIVDTGKTLSHIVNVLEKLDAVIDYQPEFRDFKRKGTYTPSSVSICTLLDKPSGRMPGNSGLPVHYRAFTIPDEWVFGYGLDIWGDMGRTLDHICVLSETYRERGKLAEFFKSSTER